MAISECNSCHKAEGVALNHDADWVRGHRVLAGKGDANCAQCHRQAYCLDCHSGGGIEGNSSSLDRDSVTMSHSKDLKLTTQNYRRDYVPKSHRSDWLEIHPVKALDNPQTCARCHIDQKYCNECHARFPKGSLNIKSHLMLGLNGQRYAPAINEHAIEARRNLQSCQSCHPEGDVCIQCHSSGRTNPHPRDWNSVKGNYRDKAGSRVCIKCHLPGTY